MFDKFKDRRKMQINVNVQEPTLHAKIVELAQQYLPTFRIDSENVKISPKSIKKELTLIFQCPNKLESVPEDKHLISDDSTKYIMVAKDPLSSIDCIKKGYFDYFLEHKLEEEFIQLKNRLKQDLAKYGHSDMEKQYLIIKDYRNLKKVNFSDILFIEAYGSYSNIHTSDKYYTVSKTIKAITKDFPNFFVRVHRSFAVNLSHVLSFNQEEVVMNNQTKIKISRAKKMALVEAIDKIA